jgi:uncharacterized protein (DUF433 family)
MGELLKRITIESGKMGGKPCIRGMRIRVQDVQDVQDVLEMLASGMTAEEVLQEFPDLEADDIRASLAYAAAQAAGTTTIAA